MKKSSKANMRTTMASRMKGAKQTELVMIRVVAMIIPSLRFSKESQVQLSSKYTQTHLLRVTTLANQIWVLTILRISSNQILHS
jgi:hypothetical protein